MDKKIEKCVWKIREEIADICAACGREEHEITLVAVSKQKSLDDILSAQRAGITIFGENRVQEVLAKNENAAGTVRWHFIGHVQTNKVKQLLPVVELIHSVDSVHLAETLSYQAVKSNRTACVLLQVNTGGEESKFGFYPETLLDSCSTISTLKGLEVQGLMTMAPYTDDTSIISGCFSGLRRLFEKISEQDFKNIHMKWLSMGMSNDYKIALREGSNMLRIGSAIFGARY